jgi:cysteinyl-tRNA synthetase
MITRLGDASAGGLRDPREVVGPYLDVLMELRTAVRADKRYDLSDVIRDRLAAAGVEVRDTPDGPEWHLT